MSNTFTSKSLRSPKSPGAPFRAALLGIGAALALALGAPAHAQNLPGSGKTVNLARPSWDTDWFPTSIYAKALEALGYTVSGPTTLDVPTFYQAASQRDVDLWVSGWLPQQQNYLDQFPGDLAVVGTVAAKGALQGFLVDKKTAEAHDIRNIADLAKPEIARLFDANGDGKADLVACPPGWICEQDIDERLEAFGLRDAVQPTKASYSASMADAIGRYGEGKPILFYTWTPNWTVGALKPGRDVVWLETPELPGKPEQSVAIAGVEGCVADPCRLGWQVGDIRPIVNTAFINENPAVRKLLETASIPVDDIHAQNARMNDGENTEADIARHADEWIGKNRETFDSWIAQAGAAAR
ncbi:MAG: glycine betaine/L-proline ABC transporter substrate-binding protein ProX [Pseudochelatococcus sp.]|uniref:glycine betaine/L-proline ABC transporter substrate-binding protein ProX n=1 Tax=Pseudochelatococcus sp. TaxID=2020869 RepID=UPI003D907B44